MNNREGKNFETTLPEGYRAAFVIDAADKKNGLILNLASLGLFIVTLAAEVAAIGWKNVLSGLRFRVPQLLVFLAVALVYVVLHELVHGAAYYLLTGRRLKFGFAGTVAYCGVPDIYVYRTASLISLMAPFTVFLIVFGIPVILFTDMRLKVLAALMLAIHVSGCVGDLYDFLLFMFRFRDPKTLMRDPGPAQTFYVPCGPEELQGAAGAGTAAGNTAGGIIADNSAGVAGENIITGSVTADNTIGGVHADNTAVTEIVTNQNPEEE